MELWHKIDIQIGYLKVSELTKYQKWLDRVKVLENLSKCPIFPGEDQ